MKYTITLDKTTLPITDICNVRFDIEKGKQASLDIVTDTHGNFHYDALLSETEKFNTLWALKTEITSTLKAIAEGKIVID